MEYGLIGYKLTHSFSKAIHNHLGNPNYELVSLEEDELDSFMMKREFKGINVTVPYKEKVIKYLDWIDEEAKAIGGVNVVVNRNGMLYGYNTDAYGFEELLKYSNINVKNKKVLILGSGGTSKTAKYVLIKLGAKEVYVVSRTPNKHQLSYIEAEKKFDTNIIINTTPYGMYPYFKDETLIDVNKFPYLESAVDVIYNPYRTSLLKAAKEKGCKTASGLYMLVQQAVKAHELFFSTTIEDNGLVNKIYKNLLYNTVNLVFIGMPASGKSNASRMMAEVLGKERYDTDEEIEKDFGMKVKDIFQQYGEEKFRELERNKIKQLCKKRGVVISLGGGSLTREENINELSRNSIFVFMNRDINLIKNNKRASLTRPLLNDENALDKLYKERFPVYSKVADVEIRNNSTKLNTRYLLLEKLL